MGVIDMESGIDQSASQIQITSQGGPTITVPFTRIEFDSTTGVGVSSLDLMADQVSRAAPLRLNVVAYDQAGDHQSITRTVESITEGAVGRPPSVCECNGKRSRRQRTTGA